MGNMVTVCLGRPGFEYDVHSLVRAFFPGEEVKVSADREKIAALRRTERISFHLEVFYQDAGAADPGGIFIGKSRDAASGKAKICVVGQKGGAASGAQGEEGLFSEEEADLSDRRETKNALKRQLYRLLSGYTDKTLPWGTLTGVRPTKIPMRMLGEGRTEAEIRAYMADAYLTSEEKISLSMEIAGRERELLSRLDLRNDCSLYVAIPFCPSICAYCSFSSSPIGQWEGKVDAYLDALEREIESAAEACRGKKLDTAYIGGGTPTVLSPSQLGRLLDRIGRCFDVPGLLEYTVEAGRPDSITAEKLEVLKQHGVSRISINPQTMKQETLDLIGRRHTVAQTAESFSLARKMGFDNINMDLIVGLPQEGLADVRDTMRQVRELGPDSLTVHSLARKRTARLSLQPEEYAGMRIGDAPEAIGMAGRLAREMGLFPYYLYRQKNIAGNLENVGYAAPGKEGLYNSLIMEEVQSIVALGAGSISKRAYPDGSVKRGENVKDVAQYIGRIDEMIERKRALFGDMQQGSGGSNDHDIKEIEAEVMQLA